METRTLLGIGMALVVAIVAAVVSTPLCRRLATRVGATSHPSPARWCKRSTALLAGVALVFATAAGTVTANWVIRAVRVDRLRAPIFGPAGGVLLSAALMFLAGLVALLVLVR